MNSNGADDVVESIRARVAKAMERYKRSIDQDSELSCPACHDLRGVWKEALDALHAHADAFIAALESGDPARISPAYEPFADAVREETVTLTSFVQHLDDHQKGKRLTT